MSSTPSLAQGQGYHMLADISVFLVCLCLCCSSAFSVLVFKIDWCCCLSLRCIVHNVFNPQFNSRQLQQQGSKLLQYSIVWSCRDYSSSPHLSMVAATLDSFHRQVVPSSTRALDCSPHVNSRLTSILKYLTIQHAKNPPT